jgi:hypothetical protein
MARELRGLEEAMRACGCSNGVIITRDENGEYQTEAGLVRSIAAIEWFRGCR